MKITFFGAGQIGSALIKGMLHDKQMPAQNIYVKGGHSQTATNLQKELGFQLLTDLNDLTAMDLIIIATNNSSVLPILKSLPQAVLAKKIPIVSVAGGINLTAMTAVVGNEYPIAHAIPNTPVQVGAGVLGISFSENIDQKAKAFILESLKPLGAVYEVPENNLEIVGSIAGCTPAFIAMLIESLGDAGVLHGLKRDLAYELVEQMLQGTAKLALESKAHPAILKDGVTSPGGSTIRGVAALEANNFRHALIAAIDATMSE
ncbi:pyrroline-5-carboxylate reductase [Enterococcus dispar]|uniref:pyrroline-5-carboxylate reductase n=1 Tax=Enterococcus dispar TaxID=44009 RepID=UPI00232E4E0A|nr:pyrroline-5-carboxylate reductase [Enterococcus dispar]WCG32641.1 pyrroline-5-carboxylate reductase [Enterococcus dispar]